GKGIYEQPTNYTADRWNDFYTSVIPRFREMEKHYNAFTSDDEKNGYKLFTETAKIFLYDQATAVVDMWGDIPFTTAGGLNAEGKIILASYDNGADIYNNALTDLKGISDYLAAATPSEFYKNQLKAYDFLNKGDLLMWRKYANALMLKL